MEGADKRSNADGHEDLTRLIEEARRSKGSLAESFRRYLEMRRAYDERVNKGRRVLPASRSYGLTG